MDTPDSPIELMRLHLMAQLDAFPEGSTIQLPAKTLRDFYEHYSDCLQVIKEQQLVINALIENS